MSFLSRDARSGYALRIRLGRATEWPSLAGTVVSRRRRPGRSSIAGPAKLCSRWIRRLTTSRSLGCRSSQNHCWIAFLREQGYDLNDENLEGKYKEWQKKLHPDLVHSKSEKEKSYAAEQSARVIDAYHMLSKPLSRALYLLQLAGVFVDEEKTVMDPELLSEMMDVREAVEEASDPKALMEIQYQIQRKHEDWSNSFREAFNKRDFDSAISATQKMRYYERAIEEIVKKL